MPRHALAFVKWQVFRERAREGRPERSFFYACPKRQLAERVGAGGTLWVLTRKPGKRNYSLAFKLARCEQRADVPDYIAQDYGPKKRKREPTYLVVSSDWDACHHYAYNNADRALSRLNFVTGKPFRECKPRGRGMKLLTIPELTPESAVLLEAFSLRLMSQRSAFLSYSRRDRRLARAIVTELKKRHVSVRRDVDRLIASDRWAQKLEEEVRATDVLLVLTTQDSAKSEWVRREIEWAREELERGGCVRKILPLRTPDRSWLKFPELHEFQYMSFPRSPSRDTYEELARTLAFLPRRREAGWG